MDVLFSSRISVIVASNNDLFPRRQQPVRGFTQGFKDTWLTYTLRYSSFSELHRARAVFDQSI